ncbi:dipeptidyl-peptidase-4 [Catalinimonas alkaloidigena]|uniref:Dipeptidyl-peptidase-4 n=1 Tax=Catalinimonas alkaloidigena TaxID=1075417 RepID=A0A1G8X1B8_9BACT|nr:S9 family peptidase [Catalinimonas alkaloidigena]SDJ84116.1 dipeptidyl-peptidase-4 [Catalinimonas alkaloidigena]
MLHLFRVRAVWRQAFLLFVFLFSFAPALRAQVNWSPDGQSYSLVEDGEVVQYTLPANERQVLLSKKDLTPAGQTEPLAVDYYAYSDDGTKVLLFTNTRRVWRLKSRGDYWVLHLNGRRLQPLGKGRPESSLMFAKFSPDGTKVAYVSENNVYAEDLASGEVTALTTDGTPQLINGTFDWAYEEEFFCRDGFRWSPDSKAIAYWQIDAHGTGTFYMINNTDSIYSQPIPLEYPKVGEAPSACRVGVVDLGTKQTTWMQVPGDPRQHYIVRMEYVPESSRLLIQQLNRKQNHSKLMACNPTTGATQMLYEEQDEAWVDVDQAGNPYAIDFRNRFEWLDGGKAFLWSSEKDGWRHLYRLSTEGGNERLITPGDYDVIEFSGLDEKAGYAYFMASPDNATQRYLYRVRLKGGKAERVSPADLQGTHSYVLSPSGKWAFHLFSNTHTRPLREVVSLPRHRPTEPDSSIKAKLAAAQLDTHVEFFQVTTEDGVEMDGWMVKPLDFDSTKRYPVVFLVYSEPAATTVRDVYGAGRNRNYDGDMAADGYLYLSLDNRGTPAPKGRAWRKAIYRKIGQVNIRDQAMAAKEILKWNYVDPSRVAVWGHSGGGSATLNLLFQYPEIYKTGIALAAVANQLTYDNIYQERYMGLPQENREDFVQGSPLTHAKNLVGNLLYIHGTGDDNVHYQNAEMLINELVKHNRQFQFMAYPNRTHGIYEGEGTTEHLRTLYTNYLKTYCPPGVQAVTP